MVNQELLATKQIWDRLREDVNKPTTIELDKGLTQSVKYAAKQIATNFNENISTHFHSRVTKFIASQSPHLSKKDVAEAVKNLWEGKSNDWADLLPSPINSQEIPKKKKKKKKKKKGKKRRKTAAEASKVVAGSSTSSSSSSTSSGSQRPPTNSERINYELKVRPERFLPSMFLMLKTLEEHNKTNPEEPRKLFVLVPLHRGFADISIDVDTEALSNWIPAQV